MDGQTDLTMEKKQFANFCLRTVKCSDWTVCSQSEALDTSTNTKCTYIWPRYWPSPSPPSCSYCCRPPWPSVQRAGTATGSPPRTPSGSQRRRQSTARSPSPRTHKAGRPPQTPSWKTHTHTHTRGKYTFRSLIRSAQQLHPHKSIYKETIYLDLKVWLQTLTSFSIVLWFGCVCWCNFSFIMIAAVVQAQFIDRLIIHCDASLMTSQWGLCA